MRVRVLTFALSVCLVGSIVAAGCARTNALVDGDCADGYVACGDRCVPGICDDDGDGDGDGGGHGDGSDGLDGGDDGPFSGADAHGQGDGSGGADACGPPPYVTPAACGACGIVCVTPTSACLIDDATGAYRCAPPCTPPLVECNGRCIDVESDSANCGACGKFCPTNICINGMCEGTAPGDIAIIGHDYRDAASGSSQAKVLTNAVFIGRSNPLRVLSYEQYADPAIVARVKAIIQNGAVGRTIQYTVATTAAPLASPTLADAYDDVLIYDQQNANAATLSPIGITWAPHLAAFAKAGGVVIALDGGGGQGAMPALITSAGLLNLPSHQLKNKMQVTIVEPTDRIGTLVASPYGAYERSVTLQPADPNGGDIVYVARQRIGAVMGDPVVVHRIVP